MLDGRHGARMNALWERLAAGLARAGWSPNAITVAGLALVAAACAAYPLHGNSFVFAAWLALAFGFDGLDGAVARLNGSATRFGGYLDAVADRYQEIAVLAAIAWVHELWPAAFLAVTGSLLTSYNKARVAMEIAVDNGGWPDLLERMERLLILLALLVLHGVTAVVPGTAIGTLQAGLVALGVLSHLTAAQRFLRARRRIEAAERRGP